MRTVYVPDGKLNRREAPLLCQRGVGQHRVLHIGFRTIPTLSFRIATAVQVEASFGGTALRQILALSTRDVQCDEKCKALVTVLHAKRMYFFQLHSTAP